MISETLDDKWSSLLAEHTIQPKEHVNHSHWHRNNCAKTDFKQWIKRWSTYRWPI